MFHGKAFAHDARNDEARARLFHQPKGREAETVVILCTHDSFHGYENEPFTEGSCLLYVILTRARTEVTVILGHEPHALVARLAALG